MMTDRHGRPIRIGRDPREDIWVNAARTLTLQERMAAFQDISSLTGRSVKSITARAALLAAQERRENREWLALHLRKNWASGNAPEAVKSGPVRRYTEER